VTHNILESFGIPNNVTAVYLAVLNLREATTSELARNTNLPRSSVKRHINLLFERGLVNFFVQGKHKVIVAEQPDKVSNMLESSVDDFKKTILAIQKKSSSTKYHPRVFFYEGASEIKKIYKDMLIEQRPIDAITSVDDTYRVLGNFFNTFIQTRLSKRMPLRLLTPVTSQALKFKEDDDKFLRKTRFLDPKTLSHIASYIYGNKVAIISLRDPNASGIIVDDPIVADAQRVFFELIWNYKCST